MARTPLATIGQTSRPKIYKRPHKTKNKKKLFRKKKQYVWSIGNYRRDSDDVNVRHSATTAPARTPRPSTPPKSPTGTAATLTRRGRRRRRRRPSASPAGARRRPLRHHQPTRTALATSASRLPPRSRPPSWPRTRPPRATPREVRPWSMFVFKLFRDFVNLIKPFPNAGWSELFT